MFKENDRIKIKNSNISGKILRINNKNNYTVLLDNNTKINVSIDKITPLKNNNDSNRYINTKNNKVTINYNFNTDEIFENEIMIRHQNELEAIENVDRFISKAVTNKEKRIKIIHGRHGGILRNAVHEYLKNSEFVDHFNLADEYEGSIGVTIVYLK